MKTIILKHIEGKKVLALFIITNAVFFLMIFVTIPKVAQYAEGMQLFDLMPAGYSAEYAKTLLDTLGNEGRHAYLYRQLPLDLIFPGLFGITYCLLLAYFFEKLQLTQSYLFYLCMLPLLGGLFDYFENAGIILMLNMYPDFSTTIAKATSIFTIQKSVVSTIYFVALPVTIVVYVCRNIRLNKS
jgi:hypothetical protein